MHAPESHGSPGNNVFDPDDPSAQLVGHGEELHRRPSEYAPEYTLVTNQYVNSWASACSREEAPTCIGASA